MSAMKLNVRPRNLTYPIQCDACGDIFDVAADAGERTACPMCGHLVLVAAAEGFELECPEEVVIEEARDSCLRLRWPSGRNAKNLGVFFIFYGTAGIGFGLFLLAWCTTTGLEWNTVRVSFLIGFLVGGAGFVLVGLMGWKGIRSIELTPECLIERIRLGSAIRFSCRFQLESIQFVGFEAKSNYFRIRLGYCSHFWTLHMAEEAERPRYITHVLRRQLARMSGESQVPAVATGTPNLTA